MSPASLPCVRGYPKARLARRVNRFCASGLEAVAIAAERIPRRRR
jgi:acetyl-CoA acetyltransferase